MTKAITPWLVHLIPVVWLCLGILYARSLESFAGIGVAILVITSAAGLLAGTITWHITRKLFYSFVVGVLAIGAFYFLLIFLARFGA